jgi:hypothetical protein
MSIGTTKAYWEVDQEMARSSLERSLAAAHSGLEETRRALKALRASPLDDLGLAKPSRHWLRRSGTFNLTLELLVAEMSRYYRLMWSSRFTDSTKYRQCTKSSTPKINRSIGICGWEDETCCA